MKIIKKKKKKKHNILREATLIEYYQKIFKEIRNDDEISD